MITFRVLSAFTASSGVVAIDRLTAEVASAALPALSATPVVVRKAYTFFDEDAVALSFGDTLTPAQEDTLDAVVATHSGEGLNQKTLAVVANTWHTVRSEAIAPDSQISLVGRIRVSGTLGGNDVRGAFKVLAGEFSRIGASDVVMSLFSAKSPSLSCLQGALSDIQVEMLATSVNLQIKFNASGSLLVTRN